MPITALPVAVSRPAMATVAAKLAGEVKLAVAAIVSV